jgi:hypothetical protein
MTKDAHRTSGEHPAIGLLEPALLADDAPAIHVDLALYAELWVRAFDLLEPLALTIDHDLRVELADDIVQLVRTTAPTLVRHAQSQREAERLITAAVLAAGTSEEAP